MSFIKLKKGDRKPLRLVDPLDPASVYVNVFLAEKVYKVPDWVAKIVAQDYHKDFEVLGNPVENITAAAKEVDKADTPPMALDLSWQKINKGGWRARLAALKAAIDDMAQQAITDDEKKLVASLREAAEICGCSKDLKALETHIKGLIDKGVLKTKGGV